MNHKIIFENVLRLWDIGFSISPPLVKGSAKGHTVEKWKPFQTERASIDRIYEWYQKFRGYNYAIITGKVSGIVVLDADDENAEAFVNTRCLPTPIRQISGSGHGSHYVYRHPMTRQIRNIQKITDKGIKFNLDLRGDGGLFVGPGSIHEKTKLAYRETQIWSKELLLQTPIFDPNWFSTKPTIKKLDGWKRIVCKNQWKFQ